MSLYNSLFGGQDSASVVVEILKESAATPVRGFVRARDGYVETDGVDLALHLYTRSGGGNRECFCDDYGEGEDGHGESCIAEGNDWLMEHPWYLSDEDDDFDSTYASFYFKVPSDYKHRDLLVPAAADHVDPGARFEQFINNMKESANGQ